MSPVARPELPVPDASRRIDRRTPSRRRTMPKKIDPKSIPSVVKIRRAAKASRAMTVRERFQIMLKAGLLTREQAEKADKIETETAGEPE
jgi:acyl-CoA reductase-like NAD-dependent aldehyde dehydrogenase